MLLSNLYLLVSGKNLKMYINHIYFTIHQIIFWTVNNNTKLH